VQYPDEKKWDLAAAGAAAKPTNFFPTSLDNGIALLNGVLPVSMLVLNLSIFNVNSCEGKFQWTHAGRAADD
jgi:hypothetical protein